jgi:hypothetical protein
VRSSEELGVMLQIVERTALKEHTLEVKLLELGLERVVIWWIVVIRVCFGEEH